MGYNTFHLTSVADPNLFFSEPDPDPTQWIITDPDPTWRVISDPDPTDHVISFSDPDSELFMSKITSLSQHFSSKRPDAQ